MKLTRFVPAISNYTANWDHVQLTVPYDAQKCLFLKCSAGFYASPVCPVAHPFRAEGVVRFC
jgi:hypothetical protein